MNNNQTNKQKPIKSCFLAILLASVSFILAWGLLWLYWPHFCLKYTEWKYVGSGDLIHVEKVPISSMPQMDIPEDWLEHSLGDVIFHLPSDASILKETAVGRIFLHKTGRTTITLQVADLGKPFLELATILHPTKKVFSTFPSLRLESLSTSTKDFRWSMSRREVIWHVFMVSIRQASPIFEPIFAESLSCESSEGVLLFGTNEVFFEKECSYCSRAVQVTCTPKLNDDCGWDGEFDLYIVRTIVQSVKINCGCAVGEE